MATLGDTTVTKLTSLGTITGNISGSSTSCTGNAATATKLATARTLQTNLASTTAASFDGTGNVSIGVKGILPLANGGTGQSTANAAANAFINSLTTGEDAPTDNDYCLFQYKNGGTTTTTFHRKKTSVIWSYVNSKISSVLGLTSSSYGGNSATATKAIQDGDGNNISSTYLKLSGGTMTGGITFNRSDVAISYNDDTTNNYKYMSILSSGWDTGSKIQLFTDDSTNAPGELWLTAGGKSLSLKPDGNMSWSGNLSVTGHIAPFTVGAENSEAEGGAIQLAGAGSYNTTLAYIDRNENRIRFHDGSTERFTCDITNGDAIFSGTITCTSIYNAVWNDYAEFFPRGEETEVGDFIALSLDSDDEVYVKASKETSRAVGIHSDTFGHLIGGETPPENEDFVKYNLPKYIPVGLVGRVQAKVLGTIKKGDFIVISDIPGVGRKFQKGIDDSVDIIGMACETSTQEEIKRIKVKLGN